MAAPCAAPETAYSINGLSIRPDEARHDFVRLRSSSLRAGEQNLCICRFFQRILPKFVRCGVAARRADY
jgi:hypothetical protein